MVEACRFDGRVVGLCQLLRQHRAADNFLERIAEAAIDAATVVGSPIAVSNLSSTVKGLVTDGLNLLVGIANRFMETLSRIRDLNSWMNDKALPASRWPQAVHSAGA